MKRLSRREFLKDGGVTLLGTAGAISIGKVSLAKSNITNMESDHLHSDAMAMAVGEVDHQKNGFNPSDTLVEFDYGKVSTLSNERVLREFEIYVIDKEIEVVPGINFAAWTYNGRIPGPTRRVTEGHLVRVRLSNGSTHPLSMHFHGVHPAEMDGVPDTPGMIEPGESFTYEFNTEPFGVQWKESHGFSVGNISRLTGFPWTGHLCRSI